MQRGGGHQCGPWSGEYGSPRRQGEAEIQRPLSTTHARGYPWRGPCPRRTSGSQLRGAELLCSMHLSMARARGRSSAGLPLRQWRRGKIPPALSRRRPPSSLTPSTPPSSSPATGGGHGTRAELVHTWRRRRPRARAEVYAWGRGVSRGGRRWIHLRRLGGA
jgi:hypothetical protein